MERRGRREGAGADQNNDGEDYFTAPLMDCWHRILTFVTEPKDLHSLMLGSPDLGEILEPSKTDIMFPLVLEILLSNNIDALPEETVVACRQVSRQSKRAIDKILFDYRAAGGSIAIRIFHFYRPSDYQGIFLNGPGLFQVNPFHFRPLHIDFYALEDFHHLVLELLRRYGRLVYDASFLVSRYTRDNQRRLPADMTEQILSLLPNIQSLRFQGHVQTRHEIAEFQSNLSHLTRLTIGRMNQFLIYSLLQSFGNQLTSFQCEAAVLLRLGMNMVSVFAPNLRSLEVDKLLISSAFWETLATANLPNLECLILKLPRAITVPITPTMLKALYKFGTSLKELHLLFRIETEMVDADSQFCELNGLETLPKLKKLVISTKNLTAPTEAHAWKVFQALFVNLEHIMFKHFNEGYEQDYWHEENRIIIPEASDFSKYFEVFDKLKLVSWPKMRKGPLVEEFTRRSAYFPPSFGTWVPPHVAEIYVLAHADEQELADDVGQEQDEEENHIIYN